MFFCNELRFTFCRWQQLGANHFLLNPSFSLNKSWNHATDSYQYTKEVNVWEPKTCSLLKSMNDFDRFASGNRAKEMSAYLVAQWSIICLIKCFSDFFFFVFCFLSISHIIITSLELISHSCHQRKSLETKSEEDLTKYIIVSQCVQLRQFCMTICRTEN